MASLEDKSIWEDGQASKRGYNWLFISLVVQQLAYESHDAYLIS